MGNVGLTRNNVRHTAVHEAGHAVIGRVVGMICGDASICADEDSAGHSITIDPYEIDASWEARGKYRDVRSVFTGRIITAMAGREAEQELLGSSNGVDGDDLYQIELMMEHMPLAGRSASDEQQAHYLSRLRSNTRALVRRHRARIETVSEALLQQKRLSAAQIDALM